MKYRVCYMLSMQRIMFIKTTDAITAAPSDTKFTLQHLQITHLC
jgi:hypothetical protein